MRKFGKKIMVAVIVLAMLMGTAMPAASGGVIVPAADSVTIYGGNEPRVAVVVPAPGGPNARGAGPTRGIARPFVDPEPATRSL